MPFRVTFGYKLAGDYDKKFTENFWQKADTAQGALDAAVAIKPFLMAVHGKQTINTYIRIGRIEGGRFVKNKVFNDTANSSSKATLDSDLAAVAAQLKQRAENTYQTTQWIKGIPDDVVKIGRLIKEGPWSVNLEALNKEFANKDNGWGMRVLLATNQFKPIERLTNGGVITVTGHGYVTGNTVIVSRVSEVEDANGTYLIDKLTDDTFKLRKWGDVRTDFDHVEDGKVKKQDYVMKQIDESVFAKATTRRVSKN